MSYSLIKAASFWDKHSEKYAKKAVVDEILYRKKLEVTQQYLKPNMHVLEFGCGTGSTAIEHASLVKQYDAIDISPKMIEICKRKLIGKNKKNLHFKCMSFESHSADKNSFDSILAMSILHLTNEPEEMIRKAYKLLKPGGLFVTSTTCIGETMAWFKFIAPIGYALNIFPKVKVFSNHELELKILKSGFEIDYRMKTQNKKTAYFIVAIKPKGRKVL